MERKVVVAHGDTVTAEQETLPAEVARVLRERVQPAWPRMLGSA